MTESGHPFARRFPHAKTLGTGRDADGASPSPMKSPRTQAAPLPKEGTVIALLVQPFMR